MAWSAYAVRFSLLAFLEFLLQLFGAALVGLAAALGEFSRNRDNYRYVTKFIDNNTFIDKDRDFTICFTIIAGNTSINCAELGSIIDILCKLSINARCIESCEILSINSLLNLSIIDIIVNSR